MKYFQCAVNPLKITGILTLLVYNDTNIAFIRISLIQLNYKGLHVITNIHAKLFVYISLCVKNLSR